MKAAKPTASVKEFSRLPVALVELGGPTSRGGGNLNSGKIILDLCGGTGSWSSPYLHAGYDVRLVTLPLTDVRIYQPPANVYGILAAPPLHYV